MVFELSFMKIFSSFLYNIGTIVKVFLSSEMLFWKEFTFDYKEQNLDIEELLENGAA